jgi:CheY-like chemotaxis protein
MGYLADVAETGVEVLRALERQEYDLILMDIQMPVMDGLEATRRILEAIPERRRPRIVAMTANATAEDRSRCLEVGMDDYIPKPLRLERLHEVLESTPRVGG